MVTVGCHSFLFFLYHVLFFFKYKASLQLMHRRFSLAAGSYSSGNGIVQAADSVHAICIGRLRMRLATAKAVVNAKKFYSLSTPQGTVMWLHFEHRIL